MAHTDAVISFTEEQLASLRAQEKTLESSLRVLREQSNGDPVWTTLQKVPGDSPRAVPGSVAPAPAKVQRTLRRMPKKLSVEDISDQAAKVISAGPVEGLSARAIADAVGLEVRFVNDALKTGLGSRFGRTGSQRSTRWTLLDVESSTPELAPVA